MAVDPYAESAFARARRDFPAAFTGTVKAWVWNAVTSITGGAVGAYIAWDCHRLAQVLIVAAGLAIGAVFGALWAFIVLWIRSVATQRNEARTRMNEFATQAGEIAIPPTATVFVGGTHYHGGDP